MSAGLCLICVLVGLALSILINAKLGHNIGLWALLFAWLIGCFGLGLKTSQLVNMWPVTFTFIIVSLSIFYGYTGKTGLLELIAKKIIDCIIAANRDFFELIFCPNQKFEWNCCEANHHPTD